jgi:TetR/AcrR family hemagglutinin/protease transcriptional regulator
MSGIREHSPRDADTPQSARLSSEQRREQLLACALKVFAEHGLEASNHSLVAAEAGVSVPLCFHHFRTRADLVDAVLTEVEGLYRAAFALAERDPALEAPKALKRTSDALMATLGNEQYHTQVFLIWSIAVRSPEWPRYLRLHRHLVGVLTRVIARGQVQGHFRKDLNAEDEAELLHAASFSLAQLTMAGASPRRVKRFRQSMMRMIETEAGQLAAPRALLRASAEEG